MALDTPISSATREPFLADSGLPPEAYRLLARANLLRMRGRWEEAVKLCMRAMQVAPDNATAHSLLGDIYENQGRFDEAIQWYRMALDVQPDSPADRLKLSHLLSAKQLSARPVPTVRPAPHIPPPESPKPALSEGWLRAGAAAAAILTLGTVALSLWSVVHLSGLHGPQINEPPIVLVPPVIPSAAHPVADAAMMRDPSEQGLLEALKAAPDLVQAGVSPIETLVDPRTGRAILTIACRQPAAQPDQRTFLLQDAQLALHRAVQATDSHTITQFTIRCFLEDGKPAGAAKPLAFVADGDREGLTATSFWWSATVPEH